MGLSIKRFLTAFLDLIFHARVYILRFKKISKREKRTFLFLKKTHVATQKSLIIVLQRENAVQEPKGEY